MKKIRVSRFILFLTLCLTMVTTHAQFVSIPDSNFGKWLHSNGYASCLTGNSLTGWQLNIASTSIATADTLRCNAANIHNLSGIQYFHKLRYLNCSDNALSSIPTLSDSLHYINCNNNLITSLPALPSSLGLLYCDSNRLTALPALPNTLTDLRCEHNLLTALPALPTSLLWLISDGNQLASLPALPASLINLQCYDNQLNALPALPASLTRLNCHNNHIRVIPALPSSLQSFYCDQNRISALPALPASLIYLECQANPSLSSIPALPASLQWLFCGFDSLTSLPTLPAGLKVLYCEHNLLETLPVLPAELTILSCYANHIANLPALPSQVSYLNCSSNPLYCLPYIYQNRLTNLYIAGTHISCLPNAFSAQNFDTDPTTLPLCMPSSGCEFYYNVSGSIHYDSAGTCLADSIAPGQAITHVKVQLSQNGQVVQQFYTYSSGLYSFQTNPSGNYTIGIDTKGLPLSVVCPQSDTRSIAISSADPAQQENFGMMCRSADTSYYGVVNIASANAHPFRIGSATTISISAGHLPKLLYNAPCGSPTSGTVTTTYSGSVQYVSPAPGALTPSIVSGRTLTYDIADLNTLQSGDFGIVFSTDPSAVVGTPVSVTTIITPVITTPNVGKDTLTQNFIIHDPHDPNMKEVSPVNNFVSDDWLTYTVYFQNTGNDTAYTVVVRDTLCQYVDASSFQYLASSNNAVVQLMGNAMAFTFPKINLVDSATNEKLSTGWIQYKVKAKAYLPLQTQIKNTAYVYFDGTPAVVTNTTANTQDATSALSISTLASDNSISLYPNPNKGSFILETSNSLHSDYIISDALGHVVGQSTIISDHQPIDMTDVMSGVYTLAVKGSQAIRFVVVR